MSTSGGKSLLSVPDAKEGPTTTTTSQAPKPRKSVSRGWSAIRKSVAKAQVKRLFSAEEVIATMSSSFQARTIPMGMQKSPMNSKKKLLDFQPPPQYGEQGQASLKSPGGSRLSQKTKRKSVSKRKSVLRETETLSPLQFGSQSGVQDQINSLKQSLLSNPTSYGSFEEARGSESAGRDSSSDSESSSDEDNKMDEASTHAVDRRKRQNKITTQTSWFKNSLTSTSDLSTVVKLVLLLPAFVVFRLRACRGA